MVFLKKKKELFLFLALIMVHLIFISFQLPGGTEISYMERAVFFVYSPIQNLAHKVIQGISASWENYFDLRGVREENQRLKKELFFHFQEIRFLEEQLKFYTSEKFIKENFSRFRNSLIPARIIGSDPVNIYQSITIDKGSLDGIRKNMIVCDKFGNLVGRVMGPVSLKESKIKLITDSTSGVHVISRKSGVVGLLVGKSDYLAELKYALSSGPELQKDEELLTTGYDGIYQPGISVGKILSSFQDTNMPVFQKIIVRPNFQFSKLDIVAVIPSLTEETIK